MLQCTHKENGDIQILCNTADILLAELEKQVSQGMLYLSNSYSPATIAYPYHKLTVTNTIDSVAPSACFCEEYEVSPITVKLVGLSPEIFFNGLVYRFLQGMSYKSGSGKLAYGAYSATLGVAKASDMPSDVLKDEEDVTPTVYDVSKALAIEDKDELISYCTEYAISGVDKRWSLSRIRNFLKAKNQNGD